jgi:hypothetical protein
MEINWTYTIVWGLSAVGIGAFGGWLGYDPTLIATTSMVGSPVAGLSLIAILHLFGN